MHWFGESVVSGLIFASAYTAAYYSVALHDVFSLSFNSVAKIAGFILALIALLIADRPAQKRVAVELRHIAQSPAIIFALFLCSTAWFVAQTMFYESTDMVSEPARAVAIWSLAPVPVAILSKFYYGSGFSTLEVVGFGVTVVGVYLINM